VLGAFPLVEEEVEEDEEDKDEGEDEDEEAEEVGGLVGWGVAVAQRGSSKAVKRQISYDI
jgi:hypothetical protein